MRDYLLCLRCSQQMRRLTQTELAAGKELADWFNVGRERKGDKTRVIKIIGLLTRMQIALDSVQGVLRWQWPAEIETEVKRLEGELRKRTRRYLSYPDYRAWHDGSSRIAIAHVAIKTGLEEGQATDNLSTLVSGSLIDRLALCPECRERWVFRVRRTDRHCSRQCRQRCYEAKPQRKEQKRRNSSKYYRILKDLNERARKRVELELKQARKEKRDGPRKTR
jgi:hypothetical protein